MGGNPPLPGDIWLCLDIHVWLSQLGGRCATSKCWGGARVPLNIPQSTRQSLTTESYLALSSYALRPGETSSLTGSTRAAPSQGDGHDWVDTCTVFRMVPGNSKCVDSFGEKNNRSGFRESNILSLSTYSFYFRQASCIPGSHMAKSLTSCRLSDVRRQGTRSSPPKPPLSILHFEIQKPADWLEWPCDCQCFAGNSN